MAQLEMKTVSNQAGKDSETRDGIFYGVAVALGICSGVLHVALRDPLLTALLVLAATMFLGFMRPRRPWRWTLLVALLVPAVMTAANLLNYYQEFSRAGIYGSALITLPGIAGAYGGHFGRGFLRVMFGNK
jgi:hypothetical protein